MWARTELQLDYMWARIEPDSTGTKPELKLGLKHDPWKV